MAKPRISRTSSPLKLVQSPFPTRKPHPSTPHHHYHSYEHPPPTPFPPAATAILSASLAHVPAHGFTCTALHRGAADAGYPAVSTNLFPRGAFELVNYHLVTQRLALKDRVRFPTSEEEEEEEEEEGAGGRALGVGAKVKVLALERLWANKGVTRRWQEVYRTTPSPQHPQFYDDATEDETRADTLLRKALALMAHPAHLGPSLAELARLSDEIWFLAGDTGVDGGWYGKRAGLAAVYASAELFMTQDGSRDFVETGRFLERRLGDVSGVGRGVGSLAQWVGFTGGAVVNGLRSKGVRI